MTAAIADITPGPSDRGDSGRECVYDVRGLKKEYDNGRVQALRGVDLRINAGEFVAITGPSGCGKTTLLQMLGALDDPSEGEVIYRGSALSGLPDVSSYRAHQIGFVFQSFHLLPTFTAVENVQIPMLEGGKPASERKQHALALLESVGLAGRSDHFPSKLSGGERQRVAVARSLVNNPSVLLADEPTGNLDTKSSHAILDLLGEVHRSRGMTMVMITHDMSIARRADRVIAMRDGQVVYDGPPGAFKGIPEEAP